MYVHFDKESLAKNVYAGKGETCIEGPDQPSPDFPTPLQICTLHLICVHIQCMGISTNHNSLGYEQPSRPRCRTITQCVGRVSANARPLQLRWGDRECGCFTHACICACIYLGSSLYVYTGSNEYSPSS